MFLKQCFSSTPKSTKDSKRDCKIVLVGDSLSGKSCLSTSFLHNKFNPSDVPAVVPDYYSKAIEIDNTMVNLSLVDTIGHENYARLRALVYLDISVALICFSVDNPASEINVIEKWTPEIRHFCGYCPTILVGCKIDLREDPQIIEQLKQKNEKPITTKQGKKIASKIHADAYIECSAKTGEGVQDLFIAAARLRGKQRHYAR